MRKMIKSVLFTIIAGAAVLIAACSQPSAPAKTATKPEPVNPSSTAALGRISAADAQVDSIVEVKPLRDPSVEGLLKQAHEAEAKGDINAALAATARALAIAKDAPDILQYQAELYIAQGDWKQADAAAQKSRERGPKVGSLCARTQRTLIETKSALGDTAAMQQAQTQMSSCRVPAPARL
ncbi:MAG TPA: hypothetical protein VF132_11260 [Rudaea sp.]